MREGRLQACTQDRRRAMLSASTRDDGGGGGGGSGSSSSSSTLVAEGRETVGAHGSVVDTLATAPESKASRRASAALAQSNLLLQTLLSLLTARLAQLLPACGSRELSTCCWALAKLNAPLPATFHAAVSAACKGARADIAHAASAQSVANLMWSCAVWGLDDDPTLLQLLMARAVALGPLLQLQDLSNVMWAVGRLSSSTADEGTRAGGSGRDHVSTPAAAATATATAPAAAARLHNSRSTTSESRQATNTVQAAAELRNWCKPEWLDAIAALSTQLLQQTSLAHSAATRHHSRDPATIASSHAQRTPESRTLTQGLANILWGFCQVQHPNPQLLLQACSMLSAPPHHFAPLELSSAMASAAKLGCMLEGQDGVHGRSWLGRNPGGKDLHSQVQSNKDRHKRRQQQQQQR
ncbi:MAG: hypothetical protein WDW38_005895 [Sanguina aurantia]